MVEACEVITMIARTKLDVADNTGGTAYWMKVLGGTRRRYATTAM